MSARSYESSDEPGLLRRRARPWYLHADTTPHKESESTRGPALFNLACEYALTGERDKAIDAAEKAVAAGYRVKFFYQNDDDLTSIRDDARFQALLAKL